MKEITYYVTKDGIMPNSIMDAGFAGEHYATKITFNLSSELLNKDEYYVYITNGGGEFFASNCLSCVDNTVFYYLPNYVTAMSGICKLQLVIKHDDLVAFMFPCEIRILPSAERTQGAIEYLSEISDALKICQESKQKADQLVDLTEEFNEIVGDIDTALDEIIELEEYYTRGNAE